MYLHTSSKNTTRNSLFCSEWYSISLHYMIFSAKNTSVCLPVWHFLFPIMHCKLKIVLNVVNKILEKITRLNLLHKSGINLSNRISFEFICFNQFNILLLLLSLQINKQLFKNVWFVPNVNGCDSFVHKYAYLCETAISYSNCPSLDNT